MQVATTTSVREHEQPMSWARALVLATGFFFLAAILIAQLPGYFYTVSTLATLGSFEQGMLDLGLLAVGLGVICLELALLYDPKPLVPPIIFAVLGLGVAAVGAFFVLQVYLGPNFVWPFGGGSVTGWPEFLPGVYAGPHGQQLYWPIKNQSYLFSSIWFQLYSVDLVAVGMIALLVGGGMFTYAILCRPALAGKLAGPARDLIVRLALAVAFAIIAVYITLYTFSPATIIGNTKGPGSHGAIGNVLLFIALAAALVATQVWLLPLMIRTRRQFMPAVYLHGVIGLLGNIGVPLLILWAIIYPLIYAIHQVDSIQFFVQCSQKDVIPASCTFTPYTGYIVVALVIGLTFQLFAMALYFWSTRRNTIVLGTTIGLIYVGLAATIIHVNDPAQLPIGLFLATCSAILAFGFTWASQREFAVLNGGALGCTGQWLVLGTGLLVYLAGFSLFSFPNFFESEALGLNYVPGPHAIHDAFWGFLLMSGLAAMQFVLLTRRQPMSQLRKFIMWTLLASTALELVGAIEGFHHDMLAGGWNWNVAEGSHAVFFAGVMIELVGLLAALFGAALRASNLRWSAIVAAPAVVGGIVAYIAYLWPGDWAEIVVFGFIACAVGALAYAVAGPDWPVVTQRTAAQSDFVVSAPH
ncbi:MAG: hypothetical protein PVSMB4_16350 [Ktedonobacterales bacterium]